MPAEGMGMGVAVEGAEISAVTVGAFAVSATFKPSAGRIGVDVGSLVGAP